MLGIWFRVTDQDGNEDRMDSGHKKGKGKPLMRWPKTSRRMARCVTWV